MPSNSPGTFSVGDQVSTVLDGHVFTGTITGVNPSGYSALIRLATDAGPGYPVGTEAPIPVRLLKAAS